MDLEPTMNDLMAEYGKLVTVSSERLVLRATMILLTSHVVVMEGELRTVLKWPAEIWLPPFLELVTLKI